jgi:hypothetical protein
MIISLFAPSWEKTIKRIYRVQAEHERLVLEHYKRLVGRRAIHLDSGEAGVINRIWWDRYADVVVGINNSNRCGHRHYFCIEGAKDIGGQIFSEKEHLYFCKITGKPLSQPVKS